MEMVVTTEHPYFATKSYYYTPALAASLASYTDKEPGTISKSSITSQVGEASVVCTQSVNHIGTCFVSHQTKRIDLNTLIWYCLDPHLKRKSLWYKLLQAVPKLLFLPQVPRSEQRYRRTAFMEVFTSRHTTFFYRYQFLIECSV